MLSVNPFAVAGASLPAGLLQGFLLVMVLAVVAGTLFDVVHKGSARYFFANISQNSSLQSPVFSRATTLTTFLIVSVDTVFELS